MFNLFNIIVQNTFVSMNHLASWLAEETLCESIHVISYNFSYKMLGIHNNYIIDKFFLQSAVFFSQFSMHFFYQLWNSQSESVDIEDLALSTAISRSAKAYASIITDTLGFSNNQAAFIKPLIKTSPKIFKDYMSENTNIESIFLKYFVEYKNGLDPLPFEDAFDASIFANEVATSMFGRLNACLVDFYKDISSTISKNQKNTQCSNYSTENLFQTYSEFNYCIARDSTAIECCQLNYIS